MENKLARNFPSFCLYAVLQRPDRCHQSGAYAKFCVDVIQVELNSFLADEDLSSDCFVGMPGDDKSQDF